MRHVISPERLYAMWEKGEVVVVDCRFALGQPKSGYESYLAGHIPGARYADLEADLSGPVREDGVGGRHPLPDLDSLAAKLTAWGIGNDSIVVAYDDQGGAMASRLWWLLGFMGHDEAYVLNGGFCAWKQAGYPIVPGTETFAPASAPFAASPQSEMVVTAEDLERRRPAIEAGRVLLIDSREDARYRGLAEPIDKVAGHIPGAKHWFWKANLDAEGRFRPVKEQMQRFEPLQGADEVIVYCGSGVTACPNVLALQEVGFTNVKLYAGSWSDWISDPARPVAKEGQ
ncbi:sulfurtransferase [Paenibacillus sp. TRM 82003]|nr:sulfurtransferase [Paenibacillus sp. TRM 82003]